MVSADSPKSHVKRHSFSDAALQSTHVQSYTFLGSNGDSSSNRKTKRRRKKEQYRIRDSKNWVGF
jgi:hypothetical protein